MCDALTLLRERKEGVREISMETKEGLLYKCFATKEAGIYNYLTSEKGYVASIDNPDSIKMKSKIMIPLFNEESFLGIVTAYSSVRKIKNFTNDDLELFRAITPFIIDAISKMRSNSSKTPLSESTSQSSIEKLESFEASRTDVKDAQAILDFTSNIVHDIRTPANGLFGFLEILEEQIEDVRIKEYISHAKSSASLINQLTTSILDGVSSKRELISTELQTVDTLKFFSEIAEIFSANMYKKSINYNIFIDPVLPRKIELDTMKLKRVIMNLISNASKFTPENGSIEFSVRYKQKEKKLHIFIKDNGIGIAKEKQKEIFEAFKQAESNTKELYGGTGLGLSISAAYVKEMGGKLLIDSELDKGSVFYFDIEPEIKDDRFLFKPISKNTQSITILLDKKNNFVANHIARYLVKLGVQVDKIKGVTNPNQIPSDTTHLIVFENRLDDKLTAYVKEKQYKSLVVEENFLSLQIDDFADSALISQYSFFGEALYEFVCRCKAPKVLIVEDDAISRMLLKTMLKDEFCTIDLASNGEEGLALLKEALDSEIPYDIVYTDHSMPLLSGNEMLRRYFALGEATDKTTTVSISGDINHTGSTYDFDLYAVKPFKKEEIVSIFLNSIKEREKLSA
jgi:signal transduction histidine kinase